MSRALLLRPLDSCGCIIFPPPPPGPKRKRLICLGHCCPCSWHKPAHRGTQEFVELQPLGFRRVKHLAHGHTVHPALQKWGKGPLVWVGAGPLESHPSLCGLTPAPFLLLLKGQPLMDFYPGPSWEGTSASTRRAQHKSLKTQVTPGVEGDEALSPSPKCWVTPALHLTLSHKHNTMA